MGLRENFQLIHFLGLSNPLSFKERLHIFPSRWGKHGQARTHQCGSVTTSRINSKDPRRRIGCCSVADSLLSCYNYACKIYKQFECKLSNISNRYSSDTGATPTSPADFRAYTPSKIISSKI